MSKATICRVVHRVESTLVHLGKFRLAGKKPLLRGEIPETLVVDVTESPIERPKRGQK